MLDNILKPIYTTVKENFSTLKIGAKTESRFLQDLHYGIETALSAEEIKKDSLSKDKIQILEKFKKVKEKIEKITIPNKSFANDRARENAYLDVYKLQQAKSATTHA